MFLRHSVHIQQSGESCREELPEAPARWLPGSVSPMEPASSKSAP